MKNKIITSICTIMMFVPWSILLLRTFDWALKSPTAEIIIACYAAYMIFSGIFTILAYTKGKTKNVLMQICTVVNSIYLIVGVSAIAMMISGFIQR